MPATPADEEGLALHQIHNHDMDPSCGESIVRGRLVGDCLRPLTIQEIKPAPRTFDPVEVPEHYNSHPSGVECRTITRHMSFNLGNAFKYIWRCDLKRDAIEDLKKAVNYLQDEIALRESSLT